LLAKVETLLPKKRTQNILLALNKFYAPQDAEFMALYRVFISYTAIKYIAKMNLNQ
jgi:hypothetical protein